MTYIVHPKDGTGSFILLGGLVAALMHSIAGHTIEALADEDEMKLELPYVYPMPTKGGKV